MTNRANVAAYFHARMAVDDRFGYTQGGGRWGTGPLEYWECDGVTGQFLVGDRDCSSSVIDCWSEALRGSAYEGALSGATYTGNMRWTFVNSGLFDWHPMGDGYIAQKGDIYLNETHHTAMCQSPDPDTLSEACGNEWGGIIGGQEGDQTGREFVTDKPYYDFPWDGILAYNHRADTPKEAPKDWPLVMWTSNGGTNQRFAIENAANGKLLVNMADGRAVDVQYAEAKEGAKVQLYKPHFGANQQWKFAHKANGSIEIVSAMDDSLCLDVVGASDADGAGLCIWHRHGGANQEWFLMENRDGSFTIVNNGLGRKMVLDCAGGGK